MGNKVNNCILLKSKILGKNWKMSIKNLAHLRSMWNIYTMEYYIAAVNLNEQQGVFFSIPSYPQHNAEQKKHVSNECIWH